MSDSSQGHDESGRKGPDMAESRTGYVAIVGRPNVGKSTLLNRILGQKLSITSRRPQTTRHQILGIKTEDAVQVVYVDTPGLHLEQKKAINRYMNRAAHSALVDVDVAVFVVDGLRWTEEDEAVLERLRNLKSPVILVVNKVDRVEDKAKLLPHLQQLGEKLAFAEIIPISAKNGYNVEPLEQAVHQRLPKGVFLFPEDQITDRTQRFLAAELVREKVMRQCGDELPYSVTVEIESFKAQGKVLHIHALILVERQGQKKIIIGDQGSRIKEIGRSARLDMEKMFEQKVMLNLWVKVKSGWADDERALQSLGYQDR